MPQIDSLQLLLTRKLPDSTRSLVLAELAYRYYTNVDSTYIIAKRGLKLATENNFQHGIANNKFALSISYYNTSDFLKASTLILEALAYHQRHRFIVDLARCYLALGVIHSKQNNYRDGLSCMAKAKTFFRESGDVEGELYCLNNTGYYYTQIGKYDSAYSSLRQGIELAYARNKPTNLSSLKGSLAELYLAMKQPEKAKRAISESIAGNQDRDPVLQAYNYNLLAKIEMFAGDRAAAMTAVKAALALESKSAQCEHEPETYAILSDLQAGNGDFAAALRAHRTSVELERRIFSREKEQEHARLLHRFELEEKENQIKILHQAAQLSQLNVRLREQDIDAQRLYLIGFGFILVLVCGFLFHTSRQSGWRKKYISKLQDKNIKIERQAKQIDAANRELEELNRQLAAHSQRITSKIENYAFLNSHKLRAPVASLIGLLHLMKNGRVQQSEAPFVQQAIEDQVVKLDRVIREITQAIE